MHSHCSTGLLREPGQAYEPLHTPSAARCATMSSGQTQEPTHCDVTMPQTGSVVLCGQVRTLVQREMSAALERHDVLVSPVAPTAAYRIGERSSDPLAMYKGDLMTVPINLAGQCLGRGSRKGLLHQQLLETCTCLDRHLGGTQLRLLLHVSFAPHVTCSLFLTS